MDTDTKYMSTASLERHAITSQHMAYYDARVALHHVGPKQAEWQAFAAESAARSRVFLFALIERNAANV